MPKTPEEIIRDDIRALTAYPVPDRAGMVKLDAMENPYRLPPELRSRLARLVEEAELNRYPDPGAAALKARLRAALAVPEDMELLLGNGSDELIQMLALAGAKPGAAVLGVEPSFVMFRMIATFAGARYVGVDLREDYSLDIERLLGAIEQHRPGLVFIAYPNNPTGNLFDAGLIERVIEAAPGLVVVDEAYHAFAGAIFLGRYSSEVLGDYCAGPNHVLPTSRAARFSSPLGVYDFQKRSSVIAVSQQGAQRLGAIAAELARGEGLPAHAKSAEYRMK